MNWDEILKEAEAFFFPAMLKGWVADAPEYRFLDMDNYHGISFRDGPNGDFLLVESYTSTPGSDKFFGSIGIFYQDVPIWFMSYLGYYEEKATSILKQALRLAYEKRNFLGGRGPRTFTLNSQRYWNNPAGSSTFRDFRGVEGAMSTRGLSQLGHLEYFGGSLI